MSLDNFIPEIWAGDVLQALQKATVFGSLVNRDYEGDIANKGDTVRITEIGPVTVGDYVKNTNIDDPEELNDGQQVLIIDQSKYFHFYIDRIDVKQGNPKVVSAGMNEAAYALKDTMDQFIAGKYANANASNLIGSTASPILPNNTAADAANVYKLMTLCMRRLDEANVPTDGRWIVVPPWFYAILLNEPKFVEVDKAGTSAGLRTGEVGSILGFNVFKSNNVQYVTSDEKDVYKIMFGTNRAITYADQINDVKQYEPEKRFGTAYKGLHLYGAKVVRPDCLGVLSAYTT